MVQNSLDELEAVNVIWLALQSLKAQLQHIVHRRKNSICKARETWCVGVYGHAAGEKREKKNSGGGGAEREKGFGVHA